MNTKTTKFLAVLAVLAMAFAVIMPADDTAADEGRDGTHGSDWSLETMGPLDFGAKVTWDPYGNWSNESLGNDISVTYDAETKTYTVKGTLAYQDPDADGYEEGAFYKLWTENTEKPYGIAFGIDLAEGDTFEFGIVKTAESDYIEPCLKYVNKTNQTTFTVIITPDGGSPTTYTVDITGVQLEYASALAGGDSGTDGGDGKWSLNTETGVLTLDNYNGKEYFVGGFKKVVLIGENSITLKGVPHAIRASDELTIGIDSGLASIAISMESVEGEDTAAIYAQAVTISGIDLSVTITGADGYALAISSEGELDIFNSTQTIDVSTTASDNQTFGIVAGGVLIRSSNIEVSAGFVGIYSRGAAGDVMIYVSDLVSSASFSALYARGNVTVAQSSEILLTTSGVGYIEPGFGAVPYALIAKKGLSNESYSKLSATGMNIAGDSTNYADLSVSGSSIIAGTFINKTAGEFTNNGTIGFLGAFEIEAGTFTNNGNVNVLKKVDVFDDWITDEIGELAPSAGGNKVYVKTITITNAEQKADGSIAVQANVLFGNEDVGGDYLDATGYSGVLTYADDTNLWSLTLAATTFDDSKRYTSKVNLTAVKTSGGDKYIYSIISSGSYYGELEGSADKTANSTVGNIKNTNEGQSPVALFNEPAATASLRVTGGSFVNTGAVDIKVLSDGSLQIIMEDGTIDNTGTFTSASSVEIAGGTFTSTGSFTLTDGNLTIGTDATFIGDLTLSKNDQFVSVLGTIDSTLVYAGTYRESESSSATVAFENILSVTGKGNDAGFIVLTAIDDYKPGYFVVEDLDLIDGSTATDITLSKGKLVLNTGEIGSRGKVTALSGTVLQNDVTCKIMGVIAIQDGATFLVFDEDDVDTYIYGSIEYTITFSDGGFTYYGNLAFALANAPAGMELILVGDETVNSDTAVKDGVKLIFSENATLTIIGTADKPITFTMGDGSEFILADGATIVYRNAIVSANVSFGDVVYRLKAVVFGDEEYNTTASAATATQPAKITFDFGDANSDIGITGGVVELVKGNFDGTITMAAVREGDTTKSYGELDIDADAVSEIIPYFGTNAKYAKIVINGVMKTGDLSIKTPVTGDGEIIIATGKTVTIETAAQSITIGDGNNGFKLAGVTGEGLKITPKAATSTVPAYVQMSGTLTKGTATVIGNAAGFDLTLVYAAATGSAAAKVGIIEVPEDTTFSILMKTDATTVSTTAAGLLKVAGTLNMYTSDTATYGLLDYDITYTDTGFTVYTKLATAATLAPEGTVFNVDKNVEVGDMTMSSGHTLNIASGKKLIVLDGNVLRVGTAATSLGATDIINGTVQLNGNALAIIFANADVTGATFLSATAGGVSSVTAIGSAFTLNNVLYCDVYGGQDAKLGTVSTDDSAIKTVGTPSIEGYIFQGWVIYYPVGAADDQAVGTSDVYGVLKAKQFLVTINSVEGVVYKQNGSTILALDSPVYYDYGTVINAVAADGYEGKTLTWTIAGDTEITATGFTPVEPESSGVWTITEILLVILVILIAIMAVIVALRLNRS